MILDPQYSIAPAISSGTLPGSVGLLVPLENELYLGNSLDPGPDLLASSVRQAVQLGASGLKLFISYHPNAGERTAAKRNSSVA